MTDLRRALTNAIRLLEREANLRRLSIEGGEQEFIEDAGCLRDLRDGPRHGRLPEGRDDDVRGVAS